MYTRTRSKGTRNPIAQVGQATRLNFDGSKAYSASGGLPGWKDGPYVVTSDREITGFRALSAKGFVFINPFESSSEIRIYSDKTTVAERAEPLYPSESGGNLKSWTVPNFMSSYGSALSPSIQPKDPFGPDYLGISERKLSHESAKDVAWNAALADMAKTEALLLVTTAELGKTLELVRQLSLLLRGRLGRLEYLGTLRRGGKWTPETIAQAIMSEWLKIRYGVMPILYEIQGVVDALTKSTKPPRLTARGKWAWQDTCTRTRSIAPNTNNGPYPGSSFVSTTTIEASIRAGILYAPKLDDLNSRLGLHLTALPETALELVRLSFVANWIWDLQNTVRALNATFYGESLGGWITERYECVTTHVVGAGSPATGVINAGGINYSVTYPWKTSPEGAKAVAFYTYKKRTPVEGLRVKSPSLRLNLNAFRVADAIALCGTIFSKSSSLANRGLRL